MYISKQVYSGRYMKYNWFYMHPLAVHPAPRATSCHGATMELSAAEATEAFTTTLWGLKMGDALK